MTWVMTASTLWQAVFASPDDDPPRLVLSDSLQEQGDPRGEFIALEVREARGQASPKEIERARELSKRHGSTWLGSKRPAGESRDASRLLVASRARACVSDFEVASTCARPTWSRVYRTRARNFVSASRLQESSMYQSQTTTEPVWAKRLNTPPQSKQFVRWLNSL